MLLTEADVDISDVGVRSHHSYCRNSQADQYPGYEWLESPVLTFAGCWFCCSIENEFLSSPSFARHP